MIRRTVLAGFALLSAALVVSWAGAQSTAASAAGPRVFISLSERTLRVVGEGDDTLLIARVAVGSGR
jgi:hypothetical protein